MTKQVKFTVPCVAKFDLEDGQVTILMPQSLGEYAAKAGATDAEVSAIEEIGLPTSFAIGFQEASGEPA